MSQGRIAGLGFARGHERQLRGVRLRSDVGTNAVAIVGGRVVAEETDGILEVREPAGNVPRQELAQRYERVLFDFGWDADDAANFLNRVRHIHGADLLFTDLAAGRDDAERILADF